MKILQDTNNFHFHNENPKNRRTSDCVVRAIATATGQDWGDVLAALAGEAIKRGVMVNDPACYGKYLESLGWEKMKQPRKDNGKKFTGADFCRMFPDETIIAHIGGHHMTCIKGGMVWDTWDCTGKCIGNYWRKADV